ncbi:HypC/HybG/HupF family hydrogenase formation chaperone [Legionella israelensis]|uniref:Hydrogenase expression/formation protein HypC n=1 Tax=Legionella israelensis TaxID=454 RepID=A0A0W0V1W4_9GAMM|nr:HypC/HybG/HupF family hydrogenase formation chaperone [Legionella israelensis]KTD14112.1 hydrogenase expression/formation protein HypC [Legionella israelensis]QBR84811.1 HypC/HybG/HupF family hydrogenase formation chaperone [Legionella israelensis]QBS10323.1 HypC/HybG/HupF family hydrogenase formation chaperone [Legionella israelensis]SCY34616.1 Hydrogenase maturation protein HypC [Legionella israelensis DSM 19235]STX59924.1 hydrogenase expression/formation protein HypC [Legionella israelen
MCLAIPAQITKLLPNQRAIANIGGVEKEIALSLVEDVSEGDYVILHVGYALTKLNEQEAKKTLELFAQMQATGRAV